MIKPEEVSILIPHLGISPEMEFAYDECIKSLRETVPDINIYTFGNGGDKCHHNTTVKSYEMQGQCKGVNALAGMTNTPWIFISNDDMIYAPGWWKNLTDSINDELCVSPKLIEPRPGAPTFEVFFAGGAGGDFDKNKWLEFARNYEGGGTRAGFNFPLLIRRDLWDTVGGYDINYDPWGSNGDSDLEYKIKLAGVQPYQNTNCIVYHFSQTSGTFHPDNNYYLQKNFAYFKEKWGFDRTDNGIWEATFEIPDEGRIYRPSWENKYL